MSRLGRLGILWLFAAGTGVLAFAEPLKRFQFSQVEMAVPIKLVFYATDDQSANGAAKAVFDRFRQLNRILSDYDPDSELNRLCRSAGTGAAIPVSEELWTVLTVAQQIAQQSEGAFDVTVGPVVRLWRRARRQKELPPPSLLADARQLVGFRLLELVSDRRAVILLKPGMRLDLGGIAKGFAIDEGLLVLRRHRIGRAMIYAGGDIGLGDPPPDRPGWTVGVGLLDADGPPTHTLCLSNCCVATSGDMWQFVVIDGIRYSHIVDPRTGLGLTDRCSVTVVGPEGIRADALATAVAVLGPEKGLKLIDAIPATAALVIRSSAGVVQTSRSSHWKTLRTAPVGPEVR